MRPRRRCAGRSGRCRVRRCDRASRPRLKRSTSGGVGAPGGTLARSCRPRCRHFGLWRGRTPDESSADDTAPADLLALPESPPRSGKKRSGSTPMQFALRRQPRSFAFTACATIPGGCSACDAWPRRRSAGRRSAFPRPGARRRPVVLGDVAPLTDQADGRQVALGEVQAAAADRTADQGHHGHADGHAAVVVAAGSCGIRTWPGIVSTSRTCAARPGPGRAATIAGSSLVAGEWRGEV